MKIVRIYQPGGAHIRFDGVESVKAANGNYIAFTYMVKDAQGNPTEARGHAVFNTNVITGYSMEGIRDGE